MFFKIQRWCLAILMLVDISPMLASEVYKWTDEQGQVHYGDRPVNEHAQRIPVKPAKGSMNTVETQAERRQQQQRLLDVYREEREEKRATAEKRKQEKVQRKSKCRQARLKLDRYQNAGGIYDYDESGERLYLNDQARGEYIAGLRAEVKRWCGE